MAVHMWVSMHECVVQHEGQRVVNPEFDLRKIPSMPVKSNAVKGAAIVTINNAAQRNGAIWAPRGMQGRGSHSGTKRLDTSDTARHTYSGDILLNALDLLAWGDLCARLV